MKEIEKKLKKAEAEIERLQMKIPLLQGELYFWKHHVKTLAKNNIRLRIRNKTLMTGV